MKVFNELRYAQKMLENGLTRFMSGSDLYVMAKYFRYLGQDNIEIEKSIIELCEKFEDGFVENIHIDRIIKIIKSSERNSLRLPIDVPITKREIEIIRNIKNYRYEKIVFTMLVLGKYFKLTNTGKHPSSSKNYFIENDFSTIIRLAHTSKKKDENIIHFLFESGFIDYIKKNGSYLIKFTNVDDQSEIELIVDDIDDIIKFYPPHCEVCGKEMKKNGKNHKMCNKCWMESKLLFV